MARGKLKKIGKNVTVWQDCLVVKEDAPVGGGFGGSVVPRFPCTYSGGFF